MIWIHVEDLDELPMEAIGKFLMEVSGLDSLHRKGSWRILLSRGLHLLYVISRLVVTISNISFSENALERQDSSLFLRHS